MHRNAPASIAVGCRTPPLHLLRLDFDQVERFHFAQQPHHLLGLQRAPPGLDLGCHGLPALTLFLLQPLLPAEFAVLGAAKDGLHLDRGLLHLPSHSGTVILATVGL